jgi:hypothetical protein
MSVASLTTGVDSYLRRGLTVAFAKLVTNVNMAALWTGWTPEEREEILKEVPLDRENMKTFHRRVVHAQFCLWTLFPFFGCLSAPTRWKRMQASKREYDKWAKASHVALTKQEIVVVNQPSAPARTTKDWPRQRLPIAAIYDIKVELPSGRVCWVKNSLNKVCMKLKDCRDPFQLVGVADPWQLRVDLLGIQQGAYKHLTTKKNLPWLHFS